MHKGWVVYFFAIAVFAGAAGATTVDISIQGFAFSPNSPTIQEGDTVRWTQNDPIVSHTVTSDAPLLFGSGFLSMGQTFSHTFSTAGTFSYHCNVHPTMTASITVIAIPKSDSTTSLSTTSANTVYGQNETLTATVTATPPASGTPTGSVTFFDGASPFCQNAVLNGSGNALCSTAPLIFGTHVMTAMYNGDTTFNTSVSNAIQQTVMQAQSTTTLDSSPNPSGGNLTVTFTATVTINAPGSGIPTGTIKFKEGASQLCSDVTLSNGTAQCLTSALSPGMHAITADYTGDGNVAGSTSNMVQQTVNTPPQTPGGFHADAIDANAVGVSWQVAIGASGYEVYRHSPINGAPLLVVQTANLSGTDVMLPADTTFLYQVRSVSSGGVSLLSPIDPATTVILVAPVSGGPIQASELTQVRKAVTAMCVAANPVPTSCSFSEALTPNVTPIRASHVLDLRTLLDDARMKIGLSALSYTGPITVNSTLIQPDHVTELYAGTQ